MFLCGCICIYEYTILDQIKTDSEKKLNHFLTLLQILGLVWFLCLMAYQLFLGYLMPKPFS